MAVRDAAGNHFYASTDPLGSIRGLVKRDGSWVMSQRFGAYGALIGKDSAGSGPGFLLRYGWTGRELDTETGLYFFRSRYYDPSARRFVQEDAIGYGGSLNLYAYGDGNPTNGRDPDGLKMDDMVYAGDGLFGPLRRGGGGGGILGYGGGGDWDGDGVDDLDEVFNDQWGDQHGAGDAHIVTVCKARSCTTVTFYVQNRDYDAGSATQQQLIAAAAEAAVSAGIQSFTVSSFTCCEHADRSSHYSGNAMDINYLGTSRVEALAKSTILGEWLTYGAFVWSLTENATLPTGAGIISADGGIRRTGTGWRSMNLDRETLYSHRHHIHLELCRGSLC